MTSETSDLEALIVEYQRDPVLFVQDVLGVDPDEWQKAVLRDLADHGMVSVAACHGPGKDATAAWAVLWALSCFYEVKIPATAPTAPQLYDLLWAEVAKWRAQMLPWFRQQLDLKKDRIERVDAPEQAFASARTARKENPEALQGFHSDVILVVVDEASGVPDIIFEVLQGALTGQRAMALLIGNPTQLTGFFWRTHNDPAEMGAWKRYRVFAEVAHDGSPLPPGVFTSPRVSQKYVDNMARYGRDSNVFRVRVLGQFPQSEADQTIPFHWVEQARSRELPEGFVPRHHIVMGVDVARSGSDDSALVVRQGPRTVGFATWHGQSTVITAGKVVAACRKLTARNEKPTFIFVDGVGVGAGVVDMLQANAELRANGIFVIEVQAGAASPDPECHRMRDALWWRARRAFDPADPILDAPVLPATLNQDLAARLAAELAIPRFGYTAAQKIVIESKDQVKARMPGAASPDLADAYVMTFAFEAGMPEPADAKDYLRRREPVKPGTNWVMP